MARLFQEEPTEYQEHAFARFHRTLQEKKQAQHHTGLEDDTRDHRGNRRDRNNIRDEYFLCPSRCNILQLNEDSLDEFADRYGYSKLYNMSPGAPMASYIKGPSRLNFWLKTGTVGSYLDHPKRGKTQLIHEDVFDTCEAEVFFRNPRFRRPSTGTVDTASDTDSCE